MERVDLEQSYTNKETARKLRRIADAIEAGRSFRVQINGHRVTVPEDAEFEIELETDRNKGELEIEMRWDRRQIH